MAHLKNFHKIVDIFVDRMFASRWDDERRSCGGISHRLWRGLGRLETTVWEENLTGTKPDPAEGDARMHIAVVMRLAPDISEELEIDESGSDIDREWVGLKVNEFDEFALEEAVILKERFGARVTALALAGDGADRLLQSAVARGADEAVRIDHGVDRIVGPAAAAALFLSPLRNLGVDLILTGVQTPEDVFGQLAPYLAGKLGWPTVNAVSGISVRNGTVVIQQEYSGGLSALLAVTGPAVLGVQAASQPPRYVSGTKLRQALSTPIRAETVDVTPAVTIRIDALSLPERERQVEMIVGNADQIAARLLEVLKKKGLVGS
jgi:electron transfer flavoprotein beta subunit